MFERSYLGSIGIRPEELSKIFPERELEEVSQADKDLLAAVVHCASERGTYHQIRKVIESRSITKEPELAPSSVVQILNAMTSDDRLWTKGLGKFAEDSYQQVYVNPILRGLFADFGMIEFK
jgi:hypothetical protein